MLAKSRCAIGNTSMGNLAVRLCSGRGQLSQSSHGIIGAVLRHKQMIMEVTGDRIDPHTLRRQCSRNGGDEANRLKRGMHLKGDHPAGKAVIDMAGHCFFTCQD